MPKTDPLCEEDMYIPVRDYLIKQGYDVKGEVKHCDITAIKGDVLLVVEMKMTLNLDVILQAFQRQCMADTAYIAVPKKSRTIRTKRWKNICRLLKKLDIGLILVYNKAGALLVEEIQTPKQLNNEAGKVKTNRGKKLVIKEFKQRHGDYNIGGCTRKKILTVYRQKAIHIACLINKFEILSIKQLKDMGTDSKITASILQKDYYNWFERVDRGKYSLTQTGINDLKSYNELSNYYLGLTDFSNITANEKIKTKQIASLSESDGD